MPAEQAQALLSALDPAQPVRRSVLTDPLDIVGRLSGLGELAARTVSIEVGMQNSGLGVVPARRHFADPLTAVPCAISSVFHSVIGSVLAGVWRLRGAPRAAASSETLAADRSGVTR